MTRTLTASDTLDPTGLDRALVTLLIDEHHEVTLPRLEHLWDYYRNDMAPAWGGADHGAELGCHRAGREYRLAQERGLPARLVAPGEGAPLIPGLGSPYRREIVIENDIAWRLHALIDFMLGKPFTLQSLAGDAALARRIEEFLHAMFEAAGGLSFFQDLALLGAVHGHVDVLLRLSPALAAAATVTSSARTAPGAARPTASATGRGGPAGAALLHPSPLASAPVEAARHFGLEIIDAPRAIPVLNPDDYRQLDAYLLHYQQVLNQVEEQPAGFVARMRRGLFGDSGGLRGAGQRASVEITQVWTDRVVATYRNLRSAEGTSRAAGPRSGARSGGGLVEQAVNRLGRIPVVHIQNLPQPFFYEGLSDVEPLIPLQDELNIRLSDRANRVTFQSFKMYLGKGIARFIDRPVGPGQMWETDNLNASIQEFGGDAASPSEAAHIDEIRQAMDKTSGVTAVAAGVLRDKVGNLTSENALRIVLTGVLARTEKKRLTYGAGIARLCELALHAADVTGVLPNRPEDRRVRLDWPSPLPDNLSQRLADAKAKLDLGVPRAQVLAELGYAGAAADVERGA